MVSNNLSVIIGGVIILALIIFAIYVRLKKKPINDENFQEIENFLNGLIDVTCEKITEIINDINFFEYQSLEELEVDVLNKIYDAMWQYASSVLKENAKTDIVAALVLKTISKENIISFVDNLMSRNGYSKQIEERFGAYTVSKMNNVVEEDERLQNEFSNPELYNDSVDDSDLPAYVPEEVDTTGLNPQRDEEEEYSDDDTSVEPVDDTYEDGDGRLRSKSTGRFVKRQ